MANSPLPPWLNWSINPEKDNQPTFLGHVAISGGLLLLTCISGLVMFFGIAESWEKSWLNCPPTGLSQKSQSNPPQLPSPDLAAIKLSDKEILTVSAAEKSRLEKQYEAVSHRIGKHCRIMAFFYKQYFISLLIGTVAGVIALICLFFISKNGWEKTNNALNNVCITAFGVTLVFVNTSIIFKEADNLKASQDLYIGYIALEQEMLSYWATGQQMSNDLIKVVKPSDFIYYVDSRLRSLNQVQLGFDPTPLLNIQGRVGQNFGLPAQGESSSGSIPVKPITPPPKP
jgi:hypothetical protein